MIELINKMFEGIDGNLISEEVREKVGSMVEELVETRASAKTIELEESLKSLRAEKEVAEMKESELRKEINEMEMIVKEEAKNYAEMLNKSLLEKEKIMFETLNEYKENMELVLKEVAEEYKSVLESVAKEETENARTMIEEIAVEEVSEYKKLEEAKVAQEIQQFKDELLEKISAYMEAELKKNIPQKIYESAVEAAAYKPLVESMVNVLKENHIKLDTTGYEALKKVKEENEKLNEAVNAKMKALVISESRVKGLEKEVKLVRLTEGMTTAQRKKTYALLEGCSHDELDKKFEQIKDIVISETVKPKRVATSEVLTESARKQVSKMVEQVNNPNAGKRDDMSVWADALEKMRRI